MKRTVIFIGLFLLAAVAVEAASCPVMYARNTQDLIKEVPSLDSQLNSCPVALPSGLKWVISGDVRVDIAMNSGTTTYLNVDISNNQITGLGQGSLMCKHYVTVSENDLDSALGSSNRAGALAFLFVNKKLSIKGCTWWQSFKGWFLQPIGRSVAKKTAPTTIPVGVATGKPDNCDETWVPGHQGYAQNKATWDQYTASTDGVCQSQYGKGTPSPCVYTVQLSVSGNPYYLCWYTL